MTSKSLDPFSQHFLKDLSNSFRSLVLDGAYLYDEALNVLNRESVSSWELTIKELAPVMN